MKSSRAHQADPLATPAPADAHRQLHVVTRVADVVCRANSLQEVLDQALLATLELLPIKAGWIFLQNRTCDRLELAAYHGPATPGQPPYLQGPENLCHPVLCQAETVVREPGHPACEALCAELAGDASGCSVNVPLVSQGQALGVLNLALADGTTADPQVLDVINAIAQQIGIAVQKQYLLGDILQRETDKSELLKRVLTAQEDERKRISRELHDETGQALTSVLVGLKWMEQAGSLEEVKERLQILKKMVTSTLEEVHKLSVELRPTLIDDMGLVSALRSYAKDFQMQHGVLVTVSTDHVPDVLPPTVEIALFRVAQEAFTNAAKYAFSTTIRLVLRCDNGRVWMTLTDDGRGFDTEALAQAKRDKRLGLLGMQERMFAVEGTCTVESTPGKGTTVTAWAPLPASPQT